MAKVIVDGEHQCYLDGIADGNSQERARIRHAIAPALQELRQQHADKCNRQFRAACAGCRAQKALDDIDAATRAPRPAKAKGKR